MTARWGGQRNYAFPPVKMVGQVVELVLEQQVSAVVIAPKWEAQWWWPLLVQGASMVVDLLPLLTGNAGDVGGRPGLAHFLRPLLGSGAGPFLPGGGQGRVADVRSSRPWRVEPTRLCVGRWRPASPAAASWALAFVKEKQGALAPIKEEPGTLAPITKEPGGAGSHQGGAGARGQPWWRSAGDRRIPHPIKEEGGRAASHGGAGLHLSRWSAAAAAAADGGPVIAIPIGLNIFVEPRCTTICPAKEAAQRHADGQHKLEVPTVAGDLPDPETLRTFAALRTAYNSAKRILGRAELYLGQQLYTAQHAELLDGQEELMRHTHRHTHLIKALMTGVALLLSCRKFGGEEGMEAKHAELQERLSDAIAATSEVQCAMRLCFAVRHGEHCSFWQEQEAAPLLLAAAAQVHAPYMRSHALCVAA
ncbi:hypothetical protein COO60DRAFT_1643122 [Scenedesmus sp. NREL 46B-D3]|nr:hypothetical protein COO60DRAFT_1643122 [Scenedesmus sp. NREL 46B-D3]